MYYNMCTKSFVILFIRTILTHIPCRIAGEERDGWRGICLVVSQWPMKKKNILTNLYTVYTTIIKCI